MPSKQRHSYYVGYSSVKVISQLLGKDQTFESAAFWTNRVYGLTPFLYTCNSCFA